MIIPCSHRPLRDPVLQTLTESLDADATERTTRRDKYDTDRES